MKKNKRRMSGLVIYLLIFALIVVGLSYFSKGKAEDKNVTFSQLVTLFEEDKVASFTLEGSLVTCKLTDGSEKTHTLLSLGLFDEYVMPLVVESENCTEYNFKEGWTAPWWLSLLPTLILIGIVVIFFVISTRQMNGGKAPTFARARVRRGDEEAEQKTFADVAGADEEKQELAEMVDFLKNPNKYMALGARIPKGVLLVGPPGTGKTLLAKATAGEAGVPFFTISGSDFVELYVGVGASRVRDMFEQAKKAAPCIIFIDEIDAVGRQRGTGLGGGHDEREQTLNQLLVEMDGFGRNSGIIVMAATNRADVLDPALLRPGRFDRQIYVGRPDQKGREAILHVHAKDKSFDPEVNFEAVAKETIGFTGADLENLLNEAALLAARNDQKAITNANIQDAVMKVVCGPEKKSRKIVEKERRLTAFHEAGHAVVSKYLPTADPVHEISIIPRGGAGGYTMHLPQEDQSYSTRNEMFEEIIILLGGRASEKITLDDISTGASSDIQRATSIAKAMVTKYGFSDLLGPILYGNDQQEVFLGRDFSQQNKWSEKTNAAIDGEIKALMDAAYQKALDLLTEHRDQLDAVAAYLLEHEKMTGEEFESIMNPQPEIEDKPEASPDAETPEE
ncbi:MAG: ATP-dependent zinc metalloprotease FtsH [Clostridia bacterium]|nr:ATP-dependent zinc metalloprotease FtsH [Clostridia bacterium]